MSLLVFEEGQTSFKIVAVAESCDLLAEVGSLIGREPNAESQFSDNFGFEDNGEYIAYMSTGSTLYHNLVAKKWFGDSVAHRKVVVLLGKTVGEKPAVRPLTEEETSLIRPIKPTRRKTTTKLARL